MSDNSESEAGRLTRAETRIHESIRDLDEFLREQGGDSDTESLKQFQHSPLNVKQFDVSYL